MRRLCLIAICLVVLVGGLLVVLRKRGEPGRDDPPLNLMTYRRSPAGQPLLKVHDCVAGPIEAADTLMPSAKTRADCGGEKYGVVYAVVKEDDGDPTEGYSRCGSKFPSNLDDQGLTYVAIVPSDGLAAKGERRVWCVAVDPAGFELTDNLDF